MAHDVLLAPLFVGLGIDELSMGSVFVPRVKKAIQSLDSTQCAGIARDLLGYESHEDILRFLTEFARQNYPELVL